MGQSHEWQREDLSGQYSHARRPWYTIDGNGKVDIGNDFGDNNKICLEKSGMFNFVKNWLTEVNHHEIKQNELINLLKNKNNYNY